MSNIYEPFVLPEALTKRGVSKIVLSGTTAEGRTIMCIVNDKAFRFDIPKRNTNKRWIKTLENYEVASKGLGIIDDTAAAIKMFLATEPQATSILGYSPQESHKYEDSESNKEIQEMSVTQAMRTHTGTIATSGMIFSAGQLYQLIKKAKWRCIACNELIEKEVSNILEPPTRPKECQCENTSFENMHDYFNCISLGLREEIQNQDGSIDNLRVIVFDDDTTGIRVGDNAKIVGDIRLKQDRKTNEYHNVVLVQRIDYHNRKTLVLTPSDIEAIKKFREFPNYKQRVVSMFAPNVIGENDKKFATLISTIGAPEIVDKDGKVKRGRINHLHIGEPGLAKTTLGREAVKLRLNSQYVSGKQTTGKALTAMVLPADEKLQLHLGPVPLAKNAICFINEFDKMSDEDKDNLLEVMEEGRIDGAKYAMPFKIPSPTTIMVSANPVDNKWSSPDRIHLEDIPFSPLILSRFDIISVYRDVKTIESDREYAYKKSDYEESNIIHNYNFLRKLLEYQKSQSPALSPEAEARLNEYYVLVRAQGNFAGNKRLWEVIYRISKAIARFYLKTKVDDDVATETIEFMNLMLYEFHASILVTPDPFNAAVAETIKVIQSQEKMPIILLEAVKAACNRNKQAHDYIGNIFVQRDNKNLRNVMKRIIDNPSIMRVGLNPITVKWLSQGESDLSDLNDSKKTSPPKKTKKTQVREKSKSNNGEDFSRSPKSPRSPSTKKQVITKAKAITKTKTKLTEPVICDRVSEAETKIEQAHPDTGNGDFYPSEINPDFNLDFSFGNFQCPECPLKTTSAINLNIHIESEHPKRHEIYWSGGKWSCRNCKERGDKPHMMETRCKPKK